jgi:phosphoglycolate phosphatase-like HAD superfamily hydrolase
MELYVLFDKDGTIANTFDVALEAANVVLRRYSAKDPRILRHICPELARELRGLNPEGIIERLGIPRRYVLEITNAGRILLARKRGQIKPVAGIRETLEELHKDEKYALAMITSDSRRNTSDFLRDCAFVPYFDGRIYAGIDLFGKGEKIRRIIRSKKLDPSRVVLICDEVRDVLAARSSGIYVISVGWGYNTSNALLAEKPTAHVESPRELLTELQNLERRLSA